MSPALAHPEPAGPALTAQRGGLALPLAKMHPSEIPLTLSADVLRLPYTLTTRVVLAEIVSLYAANAGCCDASNAHFMARLSIKHDAVNDAIKLLEQEGLVVKRVDKAAGFYRTLTPQPAAIAAKAATNPYPEKPTGYSENPTRASRKNRQGVVGKTDTPLSGKPTSPSRENRQALIGKTDTNTPLNLPENFHTPADAACAAALGEVEKKIGQAEVLPPSLPTPDDAPHTEGGAADVATSIPWLADAEPTKRPVLLRNSPLADFAVFAQAWAAAAAKHPDTYAPYAQADLAHYHAALLDWSNANGKSKHDWLATIRGSMRRDADNDRLRRAGITPTKPAPTHASAQGIARPGSARHHVPKVTSYGSLKRPS